MTSVVSRSYLDLRLLNELCLPHGLFACRLACLATTTAATPNAPRLRLPLIESSLPCSRVIISKCPGMSLLGGGLVLTGASLPCAALELSRRWLSRRWLPCRWLPWRCMTVRARAHVAHALIARVLTVQAPGTRAPCARALAAWVPAARTLTVRARLLALCRFGPVAVAPAGSITPLPLYVAQDRRAVLQRTASVRMSAQQK